MSKKATIADQILELLSEGDKWADEIVAGVSAPTASIRACLGKLVKKGVIVRVKRGIYRKKEVLGERGAVENRRNSSDNAETINKLLTISDLYLEDLWVRWEKMSGSEMTPSAFNAFIADFKTLAFAIDKLLHRWHIVHPMMEDKQHWIRINDISINLMNIVNIEVVKDEFQPGIMHKQNWKLSIHLINGKTLVFCMGDREDCEDLRNTIEGMSGG